MWGYFGLLILFSITIRAAEAKLHENVVISQVEQQALSVFGDIEMEDTKEILKLVEISKQFTAEGAKPSKTKREALDTICARALKEVARVPESQRTQERLSAIMERAFCEYLEATTKEQADKIRA